VTSHLGLYVAAAVAVPALWAAVVLTGGRALLSRPSRRTARTARPVPCPRRDRLTRDDFTVGS
jgi:hypothetical protein